jgi:ribosomal protein S18 acetylase RimI-like enzyme
MPANPPTSTPAVEVRGVEWRDFEGVYALRLNRYDEIARDPEYGMVSNASRPTPGEFATWFGELQRALLDRKAVCSVALREGHLVGMCSVRTEGSAIETAHVGVLGIEVMAAHRGSGVGSVLLPHALAACVGRFEEVHLSVIPVNEQAHRLYERFGFETYGRAPRVFRRAGRYHDFILMRKRIG